MATFLDSAKATIAVAASTWTVSTPTTAGALVEGDLLLFQFAYDTSSGTDVTNVTAPDGLFTVVPPASSVATNGTSWVQGAVYGKFVTAGEAASPPASWSFGLSQTLEGSVVCARFRGVDPFDPIAVSGPTAGYSLYTGSATTVTKTVNSVTTDADNALVVGGMMHRSGSHTLSIDTSGWTVAANTGGEGGRVTIMGVRDAVQTPPGSTGTVTFRSSTGAVSVAYQTALNDKVNTTPPVPVLVYPALLGAVSPTGFVTTAKTEHATSVRLKVGTNAALTTGVQWSTPTTPDADGWSRLTAPTLAPDTDYWWQVEATDGAAATHMIGTVQQARTLPTPGTPTSFSFAFGSCLETASTNGAAFTRALARSPRLFFHLGDFDYADNTSTSQASHLASVEGQLTANGPLRTILSTVPSYCIKSDHDAGGGNNAMPGVWTAPNRAAYKQVFPHPDLPDPDALYWSFVVGRVKFVFTDHRYLRTTTSMMGTAQKAWFKTQMQTDEPVKVWVQDSTFNSAEPAEAGGDKWTDYPTEHAEIADFLATTAIGQVITVHGDQHALAADDGTNTPGGIVSFAAAPFDKPYSNKGGPWTAGPYPTSGTGYIQQYGHVEVTDTGTDVTVTYRGYDSSDVQRVTLTVVAAPPVTGTGSATTSAPSAAGSGSLRLTGAGAVAAAAALAVGAGMVSLTGTGGMTAPAVIVAGAGQVTVAGNGSAAPSAATATGSGSLNLTGTGSATPQPPTASGTGSVAGFVTGAGSAIAGTPVVSAAGTLTATGTGAATAPAPTLTGAGTVGSLIAGTGTLTPQPPTLAGTGELTLAGSGSAVAGSPTVAGTVTVVIVGSGDATAPGAIVVGSGSVFDPSAFRDITVTLGPLTAHPLRITGLTTHPLRAAQLTTHPLTVTALEV